MTELLHLKSYSLVGPNDSFHIDAWTSTRINLVTHAHGDHARRGSDEYWCSPESAAILRHRLGSDIKLRTFAYGEVVRLDDCWISFHPAGHILGSSQIRIEDSKNSSNVWVVTDDYKRDFDPTCKPFEVIKCRTLITEATFSLPIYHWATGAETAQGIFDWWQWNKREGVMDCVGDLAGRLVLAPPSAHRSPWMKRFKSESTGFASGWMAVRGVRRGRSYEKGFVLSDHADWNSLLRTVEETEAERVLVTHGQSEILARYLRESKGLKVEPLAIQFGDEAES